jgi:hypothetical protein
MALSAVEAMTEDALVRVSSLVAQNSSEGR